MNVKNVHMSHWIETIKPSPYVKYKGCDIYQTRHEYIMGMDDNFEMRPCVVDDSVDEVFEVMYQTLLKRKHETPRETERNRKE